VIRTREKIVFGPVNHQDSCHDHNRDIVAVADKLVAWIMLCGESEFPFHVNPTTYL
jgi:hypothetical protein